MHQEQNSGDEKNLFVVNLMSKNKFLKENYVVKNFTFIYLDSFNLVMLYVWICF